jgi:Undecaprenyl-phosphate glucose phosphotransferase
LASELLRRGPDWLSPGVVVGLLRLADAAAVLLAGLLAYFTRFQSFGDPDGIGFEFFGLALAILLTANIFQLAGLYSFGQIGQLVAQSGRILGAWMLVIMALLALGFATRSIQDTSRLWVALWFVYGFLGLFAVRLAFRHQIQRWQRGGRLIRNVVILGAGEHGRRMVEHLLRSGAGVRLLAIFDDRTRRVPEFIAGFPVLGNVDDLIAFARQNRVDQVIVALPWDAECRLLSWIKRLRTLPVDVRLCPDLIGFHLPHRDVTHLAGVPLLRVFERPLSGWAYIVKRAEDVVLASLILAFVAPFMLLLALLVRLDSRGPALYRQERFGFNNERFEVFKFRTMYQPDCVAAGEVVPQAVRDDRRVTRIGRFLRRTSLDELPQFLNVLGGSMSIVGPRPHAVAHNEQYAQLIDEYLGRHRVKPGITGWAQINGLRGETDSVDKMEQRVRYDLYYIENWSIGFDLRIIFKTLFVGFSHPNAY